MIQWEGHTWGRNTLQSATSDVLIGRINVPILQISFQMAVMMGRQITVAIRGRMMKIVLGATGMVVGGTCVCCKAAVSTMHATPVTAFSLV